MKRWIRILFNRNMLMLYIVNLLLADTAIFTMLLMPKAFLLEKYINLVYIIIIMIARLFVLPNFYSWFKHFAKDRYIQNFLYILKHSIKTQAFVLILSPIPFIIEANIIFQVHIDRFSVLLKNLIGLYIFSMFAGLLGSYLVLYIYWFIEEQVKKTRNSNSFMNK